MFVYLLQDRHQITLLINVFLKDAIYDVPVISTDFDLIDLSVRPGFLNRPDRNILRPPPERLELVCEPCADYVPWRNDVPEIEAG